MRAEGLINACREIGHAMDALDIDRDEAIVSLPPAAHMALMHELNSLSHMPGHDAPERVEVYGVKVVKAYK